MNMQRQLVKDDNNWYHSELIINFFLNICQFNEGFAKYMSHNGEVLRDCKEKCEKIGNPKWITNSVSPLFFLKHNTGKNFQEEKI